jgi:hypothetical protein
MPVFLLPGWISNTEPVKTGGFDATDDITGHELLSFELAHAFPIILRSQQ